MANKRNHDKIPLPTNTTHISTWCIYLKKIKNNEPIKRKNCECLLVNRKPKRSKLGDFEKFGLIEIVDDYVTVTELGCELIDIFDENDECVVDEISKTALMLKIFKSWHVTNKGRDIHPGAIIIDLLMDPCMDGYISDHELAHFVSNKDFMYDNQYEEIRDYILEFREKESLCIAKTRSTKAHIFIPTFVSDWEIFDKIIDIAIVYDKDTKTFGLNN